MEFCLFLTEVNFLDLTQSHVHQSLSGAKNEPVHVRQFQERYFLILTKIRYFLILTFPPQPETTG